MIFILEARTMTNYSITYSGKTLHMNSANAVAVVIRYCRRNSIRFTVVIN